MRPKQFPRYPSKPHASGQARIRWLNRDYYLGLFGSDASYAEYARLTVLFATSPDAIPAKRPDAITISDMIRRWHADAEKWSRKKELEECTRAAMILDRLYGSNHAGEFDVSCLSVIREAMISGSWMREDEKADYLRRKLPIGWAKSQVNHMIGRVKRIFRFAEATRLIPKGSWEHLRTLRPLRRNEVREMPKRRPVEESGVMQTLPHLSLMVASMVRVQLLTGMRPSELCGMRADHFSFDGPDGCWLYRLDEFKTQDTSMDEWQWIVIGPECQRIILPWLEAARSLSAGTFLWRPRPGVSEAYSPSGYYQAVHDGCVRAGVKPFCVYALRHSAKQRITRLAGIDAARAVLRHKSTEMTADYASQQDVEQAAKIQSKAG